jgi:hypothetical protein
VQLRDHPLMSYHGVPNWPPRWITTRKHKDDKPTGEVGILDKVLTSNLFSDKFFLVIEHQNRKYMGCLLFDDRVFCSEIYRLMTCCVHCSTREIGDTDVSYTL